jgi:hypothetical protein
VGNRCVFAQAKGLAAAEAQVLAPLPLQLHSHAALLLEQQPQPQSQAQAPLEQPHPQQQIMTMQQLRDACEHRGLRMTGKREELEMRIAAFDSRCEADEYEAEEARREAAEAKAKAESLRQAKAEQVMMAAERQVIAAYRPRVCLLRGNARDQLITASGNCLFCALAFFEHLGFFADTPLPLVDWPARMLIAEEQMRAYVVMCLRTMENQPYRQTTNGKVRDSCVCVLAVFCCCDFSHD